MRGAGQRLLGGQGGWRADWRGVAQVGLLLGAAGGRSYVLGVAATPSVSVGGCVAVRTSRAVGPALGIDQYQ